MDQRMSGRALLVPSVTDGFSSCRSFKKKRAPEAAGFLRTPPKISFSGLTKHTPKIIMMSKELFDFHCVLTALALGGRRLRRCCSMGKSAEKRT